MRAFRPAKVLALGCALTLLASCNSQWRSAQSSTSDADHRAAVAQAQIVDSYVRTVGGAPRSRLLYWPSDNPICIRVLGQSPAWADYIKARIRYDGLIAEAPMARLKCHDVTLQIVFTDQFDDTIEYLAKNKAAVFGYKRDYQMWSDLATVKAPLHVWYKSYDDDDFMISSVIIVVDKDQTRTLGPTALADYLALVSLAQVKTDKYLPSAPTILNLISGRGADGARPTELSDWDQLYLKSIYGVGRGPDADTTNDRVAQRMQSLLLRRPLSPQPPMSASNSSVASMSTPLQ